MLHLSSANIVQLLCAMSPFLIIHQSPFTTLFFLQLTPLYQTVVTTLASANVLSERTLTALAAQQLGSRGADAEIQAEVRQWCDLAATASKLQVRRERERCWYDYQCDNCALHLWLCEELNNRHCSFTPPGRRNRGAAGRGGALWVQGLGQPLLNGAAHARPLRASSVRRGVGEGQGREAERRADEPAVVAQLQPMRGCAA